MRTPLLVGLLLCTGACAHTQAQKPDMAALSAASQEDAAAINRCVRDDDMDDTAPCPVQGAPVDQEITRMTSLLQSQPATMSTADATQDTVDTMDASMPAPATVAEDAQ